MERTKWREIWEQPNFLKDLILLSMLRTEGQMTTYRASINVRGSTGGGYAVAIKDRFKSLEEKDLISSSETMSKRRKKKVYSITLKGEEFLEEKKKQLASL